MVTTHSRFDAAIAAFDAVNADDPNVEVDADGSEVPKELLYAHRMTERLDAFAPNAPEVVKLAARAQHIARWRVARSDYPMDRAGYKRWRTDCAKMHAEVAGEILEGVGYDAETVARVGDLLRKKRLKVDPDVQLLEDVICLVFLEHYFAPFVDQHHSETGKLVRILQKTWIKMSEAGHAAALELPLGERELALVKRALAG